MSKCPYIDECGSPCDCNKENSDCRIRELFDDFYKVEKLYLDAEKKYNAASFIAKNLQKRCRHLTRRNTKLKKVKDILLNQLVVLDGECVTVQITQKQFEEYNELEIKNGELKEELHKSREYNLAIIKQGHQAIQKLEQIKKENEHLKNKLDALLFIGYNKWMYYIANGINNAGDTTIQYLLEDLGKVVNLLARVCEIKNNTLSYYTNADEEWSQLLQIVEQAKETEHEKN